MGNVRHSKQSDLILTIINNSHNHLNANEVYIEARKIINNISLGTVYRNLNDLVLNKKIRRIKSANNIDHYDNKNIFHNHFICEKCNKIFDSYDNIKIPVNSEIGCINSCEIYYNGICNDCLGKEKL